MLLKDKIYISVKELGTHLGDLCNLFVYPNPTYYQLKKLKLSTAKVQEKLYNYRIEFVDKQQTLLLPRGALNKVRKFYEEKKLPFRVVDNMVVSERLDIFLVNTVIEDQQEKIINTLLKNTGGLIEASPGGGKTIAMLGLIDRVKQRTLILVHEHRLRSQWEEEIKLRLSGKFTLGRFDGEKKQDGDIVIGLIQTIHKMVDADPKFLHNYGMIIIDEAHHVPVDTFLKVLHASPSKWRIGCTGTTERKDGMHIILYDVVGEPLISIQAEQIKHRITNFNYEVVNTNMILEIPVVQRWTGRSREASANITKCVSLITENRDRNNLIISKAVESISSGYMPLILSDRVEHCKNLHQHLVDLGYKVALIIGDTRKLTKWDDIRKDDALDAIVAISTIASEALDLPRLSSLFLTCPSTNMPKLKQKVGRIRRLIEGKPTPMVYDFVDNLAYYVDSYGEKKYILRYGAKQRIKLYRQLQESYETETPSIKASPSMENLNYGSPGL